MNCSASGLVEYLSDAVLRNSSSHIMWLDSKVGAAFIAGLDELPFNEYSVSVPPFETERIIAIGTTRPDVDLHYLSLDKRIQEVVEENLRSRGESENRPLRPREQSKMPLELWTATVTPLRITKL